MSKLREKLIVVLSEANGPGPWTGIAAERICIQEQIKMVKILRSKMHKKIDSTYGEFDKTIDKLKQRLKEINQA